jgi:CubicO group peptidase (beta-lactamase class C family)
MKSMLKPKLGIWVAVAFLVVLLGVVAYLTLPGRGNLPEQPAPDYWPTDGWQTTPPEQQGIDSLRLAKGIRDLQEKQLAVDSLMIVRNGYVILDAHFSPYDGSFAHDLASITKSVTTALVGIAVDQGLIRLDQPVVSFFSDRTIANLDERKMNLTIGDLVSMRNGMESGCFENDEATLDLMRAKPDWVQVALDRKMVRDPGTSFCYDSPGMHLLSAILQKVTGMTELEYARQNLFEPLGIRDVIWVTDPQGYTKGWGELHLKPEDAAKLGYLWLHGGTWDGQQIVPASWVSASITAHSRLVGNEYGYGYGWWVSPFDFYSLGRGGQFIRVIPSLNMVMVITGGGFDIDQALPFLLGLILSSRDKLEANPAGQEELGAAVAASGQSSNPRSSQPTPQIAREFSGRVYLCGTNPAGVTSLSLDFTDPSLASLSMVQYGQNVVWPVGLDGKYKVAADGQAQAGYWEDANTFVLEIFDIGLLTRELSFDGNNLRVTIPEAEMILDCQSQNP